MIFKRSTVAVLRPRPMDKTTPARAPNRFWFLWECEACGALVEEKARDKHAAWHAGLFASDAAL